jgi:hypothetical protein
MVTLKYDERIKSIEDKITHYKSLEIEEMSKDVKFITEELNDL